MPEVESKGLGKVIYSIDLWDLYFAACMQGVFANHGYAPGAADRVIEDRVEYCAKTADTMLKKSQERRECLSQSTQKQVD